MLMRKMAHIFKLPQKTSQLVEKISQMILSESRAFDLEPLFSIFCCLKIGPTATIKLISQWKSLQGASHD